MGETDATHRQERKHAVQPDSERRYRIKRVRPAVRPLEVHAKEHAHGYRLHRHRGKRERRSTAGKRHAVLLFGLNRHTGDLPARLGHRASRPPRTTDHRHSQVATPNERLSVAPRSATTLKRSLVHSTPKTWDIGRGGDPGCAPYGNLGCRAYIPLRKSNVGKRYAKNVGNVEIPTVQKSKSVTHFSDVTRYAEERSQSVPSALRRAYSARSSLVDT